MMMMIANSFPVGPGGVLPGAWESNPAPMVSFGPSQPCSSKGIPPFLVGTSAYKYNSDSIRSSDVTFQMGPFFNFCFVCPSRTSNIDKKKKKKKK